MFKYLSTIIGVVTAWLYMHGQVFWYGYLSPFGLRSDILALSFEETLVQGYVAYAILGAPIIFSAILGFTVLLVVAYNLNEIASTTVIQRFMRERSVNGNVAPKNDGHPFVRSTIRNSFRALTALLIFALTVYGGLAAMSKIEALGERSGETKLKELSSSPDQLSIIKTKYGKSIEGALITCNSGYCGVLANGDVTVISLAEVQIIDVKKSDALE